jgi:hypothetical protein
MVQSTGSTVFYFYVSLSHLLSCQVEMMRQGGNEQIRRFFKKLEIENSPVQTLYNTKGANHYRERLKERVDKIISGEIVSEKRVVPSSHNRSQSLKVMPKNAHDGSNNISGNNHAEVSINIVFKAGPMGMTLTKDYRDMAVVSKLMPGGPAQSSGVRVGDYIAGVSGKAMVGYDEIMHMIPCMVRPLTIRFNRRGLHHGQVTHGQIPGAVTKGGNNTNVSSSLPTSFHSSRSESSLTTSAAAEAFTESFRQHQDNGQSSGDNSPRSTSRDLPTSDGVSPRSNSRDTSSASYSLQQLQQHAIKGIAMNQLHESPNTPRMKLVRVRSSRAVPKNGSASDGDDTVITSAKLSPRGSLRHRVTDSDETAEISPVVRDEQTGVHSFDSSVEQTDELEMTASALSRKLIFSEKTLSAALDVTETNSGDEDDESGSVVSSSSRRFLEVR